MSAMPNHTVIPFNAHFDAAHSGSVTIKSLTVTRHNRTLLNAVSLVLPHHGITALIGPNGAGKSMLLRAITGLIEPDSGTIDIADTFETPALVFQKPVVLRRTVRRNLLHALKIAGVPRHLRSGRLAELLVLARLTTLAETPARSLSGGEQQRLAFARALAQSPKLLLLDEPTANLDPAATEEIETLTRHIAAKGVKIVFVTHNQAQAERLADDVVFVANGKIIEQSDAATFFTHPASPHAKRYLAGELIL